MAPICVHSPLSFCFGLFPPPDKIIVVPNPSAKEPRLKTRILLLSLIILAAGTAKAEAKIKLPAVISDHMVLQEKTPLAIWGWADAGQTVTVSLAGKTASAAADTDGKWKVSIPALKAGGPFDMVITADEAVTVQDVLVGEVWIGSGQSNMEFALKNSHDGDKEVAAADFPQIRLFTVDHAVSDQPKDDLPGAWKICSPGTAGDFSAVAYYFGKGLHQALKVPVGLIASDWGGTPGEDWVPREALDKHPAFSMLMAQWDNDPSQKNTWTKGYDFECDLSDIQLIPKDGKGKVLTVQVEKGKQGLGGNWSVATKPGSTATYAVSGKSFSGSGLAGVFSGLMQGGGWGGMNTPLNNNQPVDLSDDEAVEFYAKGRGKFNMTLGQPSITDYDYYNSGSFDLSPDWHRYSYSIASLKQGGWGATKPFTPSQIISMSFNVQPPYWPEVPAIVYNAMIAPLTPFKIGGVIWYQGESNTGRASQYHELLSTLITSWRDAWSEKFPFLIIQLPNYMQVKADPSDSDWAKLREAQLQTLDVRNTGLVTTIDLGEADNIHPKNKADVGKRATMAGLSLAYRKKMVGSGPLFASALVKNGKMVVKFKNAIGLKTSDGGPLKGFALANADRVFHWADAKIAKGGLVVVSCPDVKTPVEVRYAWADNPVCNLINKAGLPASPFRFSTEPLKEAPIQAVAKGKTMTAVDGKLVVDDFESGKNQNLLGGSWQVQMDNGGLGTLIKNKDAFIVKDGANGSKGSARIFGHMGKLMAPWPYASIYTALPMEEPMDLSDFKAIEFWAKGDGKNYEVQLFMTQVTDYAHYRLTFSAPKSWTKVHLDLTAFHQPDWGGKVSQDYHSVKQIIFAPQGMNDEDFDLSIDDVTLVK